MTKIAIVMKSHKPLCNIDDENLDINTLSAVINYTIIGGDNFLYYHDETNQNIIQHALNNVNDDITHLLYLDENLVLENLIIGNDTNAGLFMDKENIDASKIVLIQVNENTKKNISDVGEIEINPDLLKCCLITDSIELLCKKIIGLKIDFNESLNKIREKCIHLKNDGITMTVNNPVIFIGTPCFGAQVSCNFTRSLIGTIELLKIHNIGVIIDFLPNQIVTRARNLLAHKFLQSKCTHLLFIDADIEWNPDDVLKLIQHKKELCVGLYANKGYVGNKTDPNMFKNIQYSSTLFNNGETLTGDNLLEIKHGATGFMLIHRGVFDKIREKTDEFLYDTVRMNDYFPCKVVEESYLTEDYAFCQMWRETGGKVWADLSICLNHEGWHSYPGNPLATFSVTQK
jgi:hypothetical protein